MKYLRGYLVAALVGAFCWGLIEFAQSHWKLVDMIYPYASRMIQDVLANWSAQANFCLWQMLLLAGLALVVASAVLMAAGLQPSSNAQTAACIEFITVNSPAIGQAMRNLVRAEERR